MDSGKLKLISITGAPRSGKDSLCDLLIKHGFHREAMADGVYWEVAKALSDEPTFENLQALVEMLKSHEFKTEPREALANFHVKNPGYRQWLHMKGEDIFEPRTSRYHLRKYGQEYMDALHGLGNTHWANRTVAKIASAMAQGKNAVIPDLRQPKELTIVREFAAASGIDLTVVRIVREGVPESEYVSEKPLPDTDIDITIHNHEGELDQMFQTAREAFNL